MTQAKRLERGQGVIVSEATRNRRNAMYIGLGGILILILILWLLGVI